jgi:hypothetical protein
MNARSLEVDARAETFRAWFLVAVAFANCAAAFDAARDDGLGAIGWMVAWAPAMNILFALMGGFAVVALKRKDGGEVSVRRPVLIAVRIPLIAILVFPFLTQAFVEVFSVFAR